MPRRGKIKRLLAFIPSLLANMGRGKRQAAVQHYKLPDDDNNTENPSVCIPPPLRHVNYAFATERVSRQTTYYTLPPEPKKRARSASLPPAPPATATPAADAEDRDEFDVDYLYHCLNVLEDDAAPRKRTVAVSPSWSLALYIADSCQRTVLSCSGYPTSLTTSRSFCGLRAVRASPVTAAMAALASSSPPLLDTGAMTATTVPFTARAVLWPTTRVIPCTV